MNTTEILNKAWDIISQYHDYDPTFDIFKFLNGSVLEGSLEPDDIKKYLKEAINNATEQDPLVIFYCRDSAGIFLDHKSTYPDIDEDPDEEYYIKLSDTCYVALDI